MITVLGLGRRQVKVLIVVFISYLLTMALLQLGYSVKTPLVFSRDTNLSDETIYYEDIVRYMEEYTGFCQRRDIVLDQNDGNRRLPVCSCQSKKLVGRTTLNFTTLLNDTKAKHSLAEVSLGGIYRPRDCLARHRVAIIVPFRDREHHLSLFLAYMHPFLQRQQIQYRFFVVEQVSPDVFNKGSMMNIGFLEANTTGSFDCYIFHDVDMFPEDDRHTYTCYKSPRHLGAYLRNWNYTMLYDTLYGGATAFTGAEYEKVNGYSNTFYGWGGEDDDMGNRLKAKRMHFERLSSAVARYTMIKHDFDKRNPYNEYSINGYEFRPEEYPRDGLSSVNYTIEARELHPLHTRIYAKVPPPADGSVKLKDLLAV